VHGTRTNPRERASMARMSSRLADSGDYTSENFCQEEAHPAFACRSSGGGSSNRKVCVP
jgi:hypothetical protein